MKDKPEFNPVPTEVFLSDLLNTREGFNVAYSKELARALTQDSAYSDASDEVALEDLARKTHGPDAQR